MILATAGAGCGILGFLVWHSAGAGRLVSQPEPATVKAKAVPALTSSTTASKIDTAPTIEGISYSVDGQSRQGVMFASGIPGPRPLVLLFDPGGNARGAVQDWVLAARKSGWIVASTPEVRNGTPDAQDAGHMLALLEAVRSKHAVDPVRIYTAGVSGGGCGAYLLAITRSDVFDGAFIQVAHMGPWRSYHLSTRIARTGQHYYLFTRDGDMNRSAMRELASVLGAAGMDVALIERTGGHQGMTAGEVTEAVTWMQSR